ncbi:MAG: SRPBCC domain-containing protein [Bacteroidota bacterium]
MKYVVTLISIMTAFTSTAQNGKAQTIKTTFSRETTVSIIINASAKDVWQIITDGEHYTSWNSTIVSLEGDIALGERIRLKSTLDPKRTFKLKVKEMQNESRLVWGDGKGQRVFQIEPLEPGRVQFTMTEKIGGLMFPMYQKFIPPFDGSFEQFARDLKQHTERG